MSTAMVGREVEVEVVDDEAEFARHLMEWYGITPEELKRDIREAREDLASGKIYPMTVAEYREYRARRGLKRG